MWWNGGRVAREGDRDDGNNPLAFFGLLFVMLAPLVARAMQAAISRRRESLADVSAVQMTRYPPGLISALEKLLADTTVTHSASKATAHLWIEQPMSGVGDRAGSAASTSSSTPIPPSRSASLRSVSSEVPMTQNPFARARDRGGSGGGGRPGRLRWR